MQRTFHGLNWNELNQVPCEILQGTEASNKLIGLGLDIRMNYSSLFGCLTAGMQFVRKRIQVVLWDDGVISANMQIQS